MWAWIIAAVGGGYLYWKERSKPTVYTNPITGGSTPVHPVTGQPVKPGTPTFASQVQSSGVAVPQAQALHDYLKKTGTANGIDANAKTLVLAFQKAANTDKLAVALHGPLPVTGEYDTRTSAALTLYTKDPIPAAPDAPKPQPSFAQSTDMSIPGDASMSGFNLYSYLTGTGNDKSGALQTLVKQFQTDVNSDGKFPGPANATGLPTIIKSKLSVTGVYDIPTWSALKVNAPDAPSP